MFDYVRMWNATDSTHGSINSTGDARGVSLGNHSNTGASVLHLDGSASFKKRNIWMVSPDYQVTSNLDSWQDNYGSLGVHHASLEPTGNLFSWNENNRN